MWSSPGHHACSRGFSVTEALGCLLPAAACFVPSGLMASFLVANNSLSLLLTYTEMQFLGKIQDGESGVKPGRSLGRWVKKQPGGTAAGFLFFNFIFFHNIMWKNPNELLGQPYTYWMLSCSSTIGEKTPFSTELPLLLHQKSECIKFDVYKDPSLKVSQPARLVSTYQRNLRNDRCILICFLPCLLKQMICIGNCY